MTPTYTPPTDEDLAQWEAWMTGSPLGQFICERLSTEVRRLRQDAERLRKERNTLVAALHAALRNVDGWREAGEKVMAAARSDDN